MADILLVTFILPEEIKRGLESGELERKGGVIRDKTTKAVKLWLVGLLFFLSQMILLVQIFLLQTESF